MTDIIGPNLAAALVKAQAAMDDPRLTGKNPAFKSKFVPRDEALDCVVPVLNAHGIAFLQPPCSGDGEYGVRTVLVHESGEVLDLGAFTVKPQKSDPQGAVACCTYASRTAIMEAFGRAGDEDDDGATASQPASKPSAQTALESARPGYEALMAAAEQHGTKTAIKKALGSPKNGAEALASYAALTDTERAVLLALAEKAVESAG